MRREVVDNDALWREARARLNPRVESGVVEYQPRDPRQVLVLRRVELSGNPGALPDVRHGEKMTDLRQRIQARLAARMKQREGERMTTRFAPPRYDEVFAEITRRLDEDARVEVKR